MPRRPTREDRREARSFIDEMRRMTRSHQTRQNQLHDERHDRFEQLVDRIRHQRDTTDVVWTRLERATPRARREVERIVDVAIKIADLDGLEALSMRRLATTLGTGTTSLYRHVQNKEELLTLMVDAVNRQDPFPDGPPDDWREAFAIVARANRAQMLEHPWLASEIASRPAIGPNTLRAADMILGVAMRLGLDAATAASVVATLFRYVHGAALSELAELDAERRTGMTQDEWRRSIGGYVAEIVESGRYPSFAAVVAADDPTDDEQFEFGLARLLDGFERLAIHPKP